MERRLQHLFLSRPPSKKNLSRERVKKSTGPEITTEGFNTDHLSVTLTGTAIILTEGTITTTTGTTRTLTTTVKDPTSRGEIKDPTSREGTKSQ